MAVDAEMADAATATKVNLLEDMNSFLSEPSSYKVTFIVYRRHRVYVVRRNFTLKLVNDRSSFT